ncbi:hypothetical protein HYS28_01700 [Candidatus Uhrbacteria bacterium]|nr:hypothetical protein [Candidatus Uhrbacteria bacterium]
MNLDLLEAAQRVLGWSVPKASRKVVFGGMHDADLVVGVGTDPEKKAGAYLVMNNAAAIYVNSGKETPSQLSPNGTADIYGKTVLNLMEANAPATLCVEIQQGMNLEGAGRGIARALLRPGLGKTAASAKYYAGPTGVIVNINVPTETAERSHVAFERGWEMGCYENFQCWLGQLPPNILNPESYAVLIEKLIAEACDRYPETSYEMIEPEMEGYQRMQLLNAVARASNYPGEVRAISAAVLAAALYFMAHPEELACTTVFAVGLVENVIAQDAYLVEEIITSYSGATVRVLNTDAEGRLVLADVLSWTCERFGLKDGDEVLVNATLTGHAVVVVGDEMSTLMVRDNLKDVVATLEQLGDEVGDPVQPLRLTDQHYNAMKDTVADYKNLSELPDKACGTQTGAAFCSFFVPKGVRYVHHDLATAGGDTGNPDVGRAKGLPSNGGMGLGIAYLKKSSALSDYEEPVR